MVGLIPSRHFRHLALIALVASFFQASTAEAGNSAVLRIYLLPAYPVEMNWNSPRELFVSSIKAMAANIKYKIGHVNIEVSCPNEGWRGSRFLTGAAPDGPKDNAALLFKDQVGFSVLEASWLGKIEKTQEVRKALDSRKASRKKLAVMSFLISDQTCRRLLDYYRELTSSDRPFYYGNSPRPRYKEGSGCSAFGVSFMEVAGVMRSEWRNDWIAPRRVPLELMGGYGADSVSVFDMLRMPAGKRWANADEPHMALETFEPTWMFKWIRNLADDPEKLRAVGGQIDRSLASRMPNVAAILFDQRHVPTPAEPIFHSEPKLAPYNDYSVMRSDKEYGRDGSFELKP